ncbi:MAG: bifunctional [glutamine synthetase] adenylyltransferase/[glutamine synthetase]-adenylyl-L-tyrosine phosphorylase [Hyphomicrobiales bacterium]
MKRAAKAPARKSPDKPADGQSGESSLADLITAAPHLISPEAAKARVAGWLAEIKGDAAGDPLKALLSGHPTLTTLIESLAESSPYLWELASREPARLLNLLQSDPEKHFASLLAQTARAVSAATDDANAMHLLRRMKSEAALLIALADIGGVWPVMRTTHALTDVADTAVRSAVRYLLSDAARAERISPPDPANPENGSGYIVLAMGKMGAFELNYSSDIDLIVFFDPGAPALPKDLEATTFFVRLTQRLVKLMQQRTVNGYVFRTDLRLRPDPASTPIAVSIAAGLTYYESVGQNWERAAMIKARVCAGDPVAGAAMLNNLAPFVWRKYLDFASVAEVHAMKRQIHAYKGHGEIAVEGHNVKLGRGGIREIEFFVQTQQLVAGGRHPELRERETLSTLATLAAGNWIDADARADMEAAYYFLRTVEHRLQMVNDEQTQTLPEEREDLEKFSRFLGFEDRDAFAKVLLGHMGKVQRHYAKLFEAAPAPDAPALNFPPQSDDRKTLDRLAEMGFRSPLEASALIRQWLAGGHRPLKGEAARAELVALLPVLLDHLSRSETPDAVLKSFDGFLAGLHGGARLLSLLRQNPELIALITLILGIAPRLSDILARYPQVMDALVDPSFFGAFPSEAVLTTRLKGSIAQSGYDEDFLERIRMFGLEYMFLIGARILSGTLTAQQAGEAFARLADVIVRSIHTAVAQKFAETHGHLRNEAAAVLALGKLGGMEMTATSDLDLIIVYDFDEEHPESDGTRPLHGTQYFARLTQRLINALTAQTNYGALYQVDMRLRPSGRSGPLATQIEGFESYQETEAWTWEHLALTRARVVSASPGFGARAEQVISKILRRERDATAIAGDVVEMRGAIATEKGDSDRWNLKYAAGGLIDVEFITQYLQLIHAAKLPDILDTSTARVLDKAWRLGVLPLEDAEVLRPAVKLYHDVTQILRLCLTKPFDPKTAGAGLLRLLARAADVPDFATLDAHLIETQTKVRASFVRILGSAP